MAYFEQDLAGLDVERFEHAVNRVIERQPMLRTVVRSDGRQQVLAEVPRYRVELVDLRHLEPSEREATLAEACEELSRAGMQPETWPAFSIRVHHVAAGAYRIHLALPLLLSDLQSDRVLFHEIDTFYRNPDAVLPELRIHFRDYVQSLAILRQSAAYQRAESYWRERLSQLPTAPALPRAAASEIEGEATFVRHEAVLPRPAWERIKKRARAAGLTSSAIVAAAYADAIAAFSETAHFCLNLLYLDRPPVHPQIDQLIGNFGTTLMLEVDNRESDSFANRANRLQAQLWRDLEHVQVSGVQVLRELGRRGSSAASSVPIVLASTLHLSADEIAPDSVLGSLVMNRLHTPHVWIDHQVNEAHEGLSFRWDVREGVFPAGLSAAMFAVYCDLLEQLAAGSGWDEYQPARIGADQLAAREQANATDAPVSDKMLHELFFARAAQQPDRLAVITPHRSLGYGELAAEVNALARKLRRLGVGANQLVAISMDKGWEQIVAALAVVNAGGTYLPVDPSLPQERRHYLVSYSNASVVLIQRRENHRDRALDWPEDVTVVAVEEGAREGEYGEDVDTAEIEALSPLQKATDLAYVIFTSGSTGMPKGVMIDHRGAVNTVLDINDRFAISQDDRVLALSSLSFDLSVYDVFGPLAAGGSVVIPDAAEVRDPAHWASLVREHDVTVWNSVPQLMQLLVDREEQLGEGPLSSLRVAMLSGDWIPVTLPDRIGGRAPNCRVFSLGGATEASIWSIIYPIERVESTWQSIPYGKPLRNQIFYVLDDALEHRPIWVSGELYIGGVGVAQGYLGDTEKTRHRFIEHPVTGERLYRTGDLGRYLPDGNIEFLGRADFQVKIQGFRIELGEIEAQLEKHPALRACVVTAHGPRRGEKRLVAYVVESEDGKGASPDESGSASGSELYEALQAHLAETLPSYMVPSQFVTLPALPLTANGKVDRGGLPAPEAARTGEQTAEQVAPRNQVEETLAAIWCEVLGVAQVGVHDDFFAQLGGHSFAAVRLLARVHAQTGQELPLSSLLSGPTIAAQASLIAASVADADGGAWSPLVPLRTEGHETPLYLVHPIGGNVLCYRDLVAAMDPGRPVYGLQACGFAAEQAPLATLPEMARSYVKALRQVQAQGPYLLGGWSMGGLVAHAMASELEAAGEEVALLMLIDSALPGHSELLSSMDLLSWFMRDLLATSGKAVDFDYAAIEAMGEDERIAAVLDQAQRAGAIASDVSTEQLACLYRVFVQNSAAMDAYAPLRVSAPAVMLDAGRSAIGDGPTRLRTWKRWTASAIRRRLPGDHYSLVSTHVAVLAERLDIELYSAERARRQRSAQAS